MKTLSQEGSAQSSRSIPPIIGGGPGFTVEAGQSPPSEKALMDAYMAQRSEIERIIEEIKKHPERLTELQLRLIRVQEKRMATFEQLSPATQRLLLPS